MGEMGKMGMMGENAGADAAGQKGRMTVEMTASSRNTGKTRNTGNGADGNGMTREDRNGMGVMR